MRVFVTGASGHIGSALIPDLLTAGHEVIGLARSDKAAAAVAAAGARVHRGDLDDVEGLRRAATAADGVIHLAFKHDLSLSGAPDGFVTAGAHDLRAIQAIGDALKGSGKPLVTTSGTGLLAFARFGRTGTEEDTLPGGPRVDSENATIALAQHGVRSSAVRLPPTVHSSLDRAGFIPSLIAMARKNGFAAYVEKGANLWPAVHTLDAARLFRLALESAPAGSRLHGVAEQGVPFREIAETIGRRLGVPAKSVGADAAAHALGPLAMFAEIDNPTSSTRTREILRWQPTHLGLLADLAERHYFERQAP
jgi:nucleoside-diphosphate-sugar epimerase